MEQTHSRDVLVVDERRRGEVIPIIDGLATDVEGLFLLVRTADCLPLLLFDPVRGAVAAAHSGREGTRRNIAAACVQVLCERFGSNPGDIRAALGPAIAVESYEVALPTWERFMRTALTRHPWRRVNIRAEVTAQLLAAGLHAPNIAQLPHDTCVDSRYCSWRARQSTCRQVSIIGKISVDENGPDR